MAPVQFSDEVLRLLRAVVGSLFEYALATITEDNRAEFEQRYQRRRNLAQLAHFPEGYWFQHDLVDGTDQASAELPLLTPPDLIAVQDADGNWTRRARNDEEDGPEPYSAEWYHHYLVENHLPLWFMRPEHLSMLDENTEAEALGVRNEPTEFTNLPGRYYLDAQYPDIPYYPRTNNSRLVEIRKVPQKAMTHLMRRFPAVAVNNARKDYQIFVAPSGHIILRHRSRKEVEQDASLPEIQLEWSSERLGLPRASSYSFVPHATERSVEDREELEEAHRNAGGWPRLEMRPAGRGEWRWLRRAVDEQMARRFTLRTLEQVTNAQLNRTLTGPLATRPTAVWYPDPDTFNPTTAQTEPGQWAFHTQGDRDEAHINLGAQDEYGFANVAQPTAQQVWDLRQQYQQDSTRPNFNPTQNINLVWVIPGDDAHRFNDTPEVPGENIYGVEVQRISPPPDHGRDPDSGLTHEPTNGGANDQTGTPGVLWYQTKMINGKQITGDRSHAEKGVPEPHKLWVPMKNGDWLQWPQAAKIDWNSKKMIDVLNKWRDQRYRRDDWPKKRPEEREMYTIEQKKYMFDLVKGDKDRDNVKAAIKEWLKKFPDAQRKENGLEALASRMAAWWEKHDSTWKEPPGRRKRLKEDGEEDEEEEEEKEEEEKDKKTKKRKRNEDDDFDPMEE